jgi:hypothetical protein
MRDVMCRLIRWEKLGRGEDALWQPANAPTEIAKTLLERRGEWRFPLIAGVISTPTLRPDGSLLSKPGYDPQTCLYLINPVAVPAIPAKPSRDDALQALALLKGLLVEFPFVFTEGKEKKARNASLSVALSAILTAACRSLMDVAPAHGARAPAPGTGKSYIFDIVAAIVLGYRCPVIAAAVNPEETEKKIVAKALSGYPIINIDNLNGGLRGDALSQLIERPICDFRVFGKLEDRRVMNRACVFFNGNNVHVAGDLTRRCLLASLDAKMERPETRKFKTDPVETVLTDRGRYIAACLTIVRAFIIAGRPGAEQMPSFDMWSQSIRGALTWLGEPDPVNTMEVVREEDPDRLQLIMMIDAMRDAEVFGIGKAVSARALVAKAKDASATALIEALGTFEQRGEVNLRRLGMWLARMKGRIMLRGKAPNEANLCISSTEDAHSKIQLWYVQDCSTEEAANA